MYQVKIFQVVNFSSLDLDNIQKDLMLFCYRVVETELESHFLITEQMLVREALKR